MTTQKATNILVVDSYANGISIGKSRRLDSLLLKLSTAGEPGELRRRYALFHKNGFSELEDALADLSKKGTLGSSVVVLGVDSDPFFPFDTAFSASLKFLELFEKYTPAKVIIQTRSPLIVIALPVLQKLKSQLKVVFGIETTSDEMGKRYTPELPLVSERIKAMRTLKRFGIYVSAQIAPVLPYGDWRADAKKSAALLADATSEAHVESLVDLEKRGLKLQVAKVLAAERKFHWLRHDAAEPMINALRDLGVYIPAEREDFVVPDRQLSLFKSEKRA